MSTQAAFLRALADHIEHHDLPPVNIHSDFLGGYHLQLLTDTHPGLTQWARSLNIVRLTVHAHPQQTTVEFSSQLAGHPLRVWGRIEPLGDIEPITVNVTDLAYFTEHNTLPGGAR